MGAAMPPIEVIAWKATAYSSELGARMAKTSPLRKPRSASPAAARRTSSASWPKVSARPLGPSIRAGLSASRAAWRKTKGVSGVSGIAIVGIRAAKDHRRSSCPVEATLQRASANRDQTAASPAPLRRREPSRPRGLPFAAPDQADGDDRHHGERGAADHERQSGRELVEDRSRRGRCVAAPAIIEELNTPWTRPWMRGSAVAAR